MLEFHHWIMGPMVIDPAAPGAAAKPKRVRS